MIKILITMIIYSKTGMSKRTIIRLSSNGVFPHLMWRLFFHTLAPQRVQARITKLQVNTFIASRIFLNL